MRSDENGRQGDRPPDVFRIRHRSRKQCLSSEDSISDHNNVRDPTSRRQNFGNRQQYEGSRRLRRQRRSSSSSDSFKEDNVVGKAVSIPSKSAVSASRISPDVLPDAASAALETSPTIPKIPRRCPAAVGTLEAQRSGRTKRLHSPTDSDDTLLPARMDRCRRRFQARKKLESSDDGSSSSLGHPSSSGSFVVERRHGEQNDRNGTVLEMPFQRRLSCRSNGKTSVTDHVKFRSRSIASSSDENMRISSDDNVAPSRSPPRAVCSKEVPQAQHSNESPTMPKSPMTVAHNVVQPKERPINQKACQSSPHCGEHMLVSSSQDHSQHDPHCYVCGSEKFLGQETHFTWLYCNGCLRTYHSACLPQEQTQHEQERWICPKCFGQTIRRTVTFYRYGNPVEATSTTLAEDSLDAYLKKFVGLSGQLDGCGKCGGASSQRRMAVICDNCEREFHLACLHIDSDELPHGNWLCPDCLEMHICIVCILKTRRRSSLEDNDDKDMCRSSSELTCYYHSGHLIQCRVCYLRYHPECANSSAPLHLRYSQEELLAQYTACYQKLVESTPDPLPWKLYLRQLGVADPATPEFWCCQQCQDLLGVQRILGQRRWVDPSASSNQESNNLQPTEQIQLLVKLKGLSYRALMWLPLNRMRVLYSGGVRKWQLTPAAVELLDGHTSSLSGNIPQADDDDALQRISTEEEDEPEESPDAEQDLGGSDEQRRSEDGGASSSSVGTGKRASSFQNSSSVKKVVKDKKPHFVLHVYRPPGVKAQWLCPCRVLARRICPRGTLRVEYLVKWIALPYEEATWEPLLTVLGTHALTFFEACDTVENLISLRPRKLVRPTSNHDPTVYVLENHLQPPLPEGVSLVANTQFVIKTSAIESERKLKSGFSPTENALNKDASPTATETSHGIQQKHPEPADLPSVLEKRRLRYASGAFVPYTERPSFLHGHYLYDYQLEGINWLRFAWEKRRSVILADEMGLGKTVQVIAFLGSLWNDAAVQGPFLIIAPLATLEDVWARELALWAPFINTVTYFGNPESRQRCCQWELFSSTPAGQGTSDWIRRCFYEQIQREYDRPTIRPRLPKLANKDRFAKFDALVTSYEIFRKDHFLFKRINWKVIVVDEGHRLKSFGSEVKKALEACQSEMRLLLTGTPLQNTIDELFSLLNVLHPEKFPENSKDKYQDVTQESVIENLKTELQAHILRRTKRDVMGGRMPKKKERLLLVENSPNQKEIYKSIIWRNHATLGSTANGKLNGNKKNIRLASLRNIVMQMRYMCVLVYHPPARRKCCNHPYLFEETTPIIRTEEDFNELVASSGKMMLLDRMLTLLKPAGHRVLIFSQFMRMLDILEEYLNYKQYGYERLDGSTSAAERQRAIDRFNVQVQRKFVFLLSTRAGGLGINLTSADTVIIFDSDWNPHNDLQAQARAHRLGQTKKVAIYRFMTRASVEERIIEIARNKLVLDQVVAGKISPRDVEAVVRCGAKELFDESSTGREVHYDDGQLRLLLDRRDINDDDEEKISGGEFSSVVQSGVLDAFKVAHFEDAAGDQTDESETFWSDLLNKQEVPPSQHDLDQDFEDATLGRGMRARREVSYFGQDRLRERLMLEDESEDDDEDEEADEYAEPKSGMARGIVDTGKASLSVSPMSPQGAPTASERHIAKRSRKTPKQDIDPFDRCALVVCRSRTPSTFSVVTLTEHSTVRTEFRETHPAAATSLLEHARGVRKSLGLPETLKRLDGSPHAMETCGSYMEDDPELKETQQPPRMTVFGLTWDLNWLSSLLNTQSEPRLPKHPPFIISHGERYFLLTPPVVVSPTSNATDDRQQPSPLCSFGVTVRVDAVALMRELVHEETLKWQTQMTTAFHRAVTVLHGGLRSDASKSRQLLAAAWGVSGGSGYDVGRTAYPNVESIRRALDAIQATSPISDDVETEDQEPNDMTIDQVFNVMCCDC